VAQIAISRKKTPDATPKMYPPTENKHAENKRWKYTNVVIFLALDLWRPSLSARCSLPKGQKKLWETWLPQCRIDFRAMLPQEAFLWVLQR
jgi:hypothetical protein